MRITPVLLIALVMDIFVIFGIPAIIGDVPADLTGHILGSFVSGDASHPDSLEFKNSTVLSWVNLEPGGDIFSELVAGIVGILATIQIFITFITLFVFKMITFPYDLLMNYHLPTMYAIILGSIYSLLNITAVIELASGRGT